VGRAQLVRNKKKVLILGDGFAGVECARQLESKFGNDPETQRPFPSTAEIAEAQAKTVAKNLKTLIENLQKEKFAYHSKGQMVIIGKRAGIATFLGMNISGFWA